MGAHIVEVSKILLSLLEIAGTASTARGRSESPAAAAAAAAARARRTEHSAKTCPQACRCLQDLAGPCRLALCHACRPGRIAFESLVNKGRAPEASSISSSFHKRYQGLKPWRQPWRQLAARPQKGWRPRQRWAAETQSSYARKSLRSSWACNFNKACGKAIAMTLGRLAAASDGKRSPEEQASKAGQ